MNDLNQEYIRVATLYKNLLEFMIDYDGVISNSDYSAIEDASAVLEDVAASAYVEKEKAREEASIGETEKYVNDNKLTAIELGVVR